MRADHTCWRRCGSTRLARPVAAESPALPAVTNRAVIAGSVRTAALTGTPVRSSQYAMPDSADSNAPVSAASDGSAASASDRISGA